MQKTLYAPYAGKNGKMFICTHFGLWAQICIKLCFLLGVGLVVLFFFFWGGGSSLGTKPSLFLLVCFGFYWCFVCFAFGLRLKFSVSLSFYLACLSVSLSLSLSLFFVFVSLYLSLLIYFFLPCSVSLLFHCFFVLFCCLVLFFWGGGPFVCFCYMK